MDSGVDEILSAFLDGEAVDAAELASTLAQPGAREALLDFVRLRAWMEDDEAPSPAFLAAMRTRLKRPPLVRLAGALRLAAAAIVLALAAIGALDLGHRFQSERRDEPPQASRVIHFEPGVDWTEKPGG